MALKALMSAGLLQRDILKSLLARLDNPDTADVPLGSDDDDSDSDIDTEDLEFIADREITFEVNRFQNVDNYKKYLLFFLETGVTTMVQTIRWLYKGPRVEDCIVEMSQNKLNAKDKDKLKKLQMGTMKLTDFDVTLLFKIVTTNCGLANKDDSVWTRNCSMLRRTELEYLLFVLKDGRNNVSHPGTIEKSLTLADVRQKSEEMKDLLTSILERAGEKANIDATDITYMIKIIEEDIARILGEKSPQATISAQARKSLDRTIKIFLKPIDNDRIFGLNIQAMNLTSCFSSELIFLDHSLKFLITPKRNRYKILYYTETSCLEFAPFSGKGTDFTIHGSIEAALSNYAHLLVSNGITNCEEIKKWLRKNKDNNSSAVFYC